MQSCRRILKNDRESWCKKGECQDCSRRGGKNDRILSTVIIPCTQNRGNRLRRSFLVWWKASRLYLAFDLASFSLLLLLVLRLPLNDVSPLLSLVAERSINRCSRDPFFGRVSSSSAWPQGNEIHQKTNRKNEGHRPLRKKVGKKTSLNLFEFKIIDEGSRSFECNT